jgi:hypothetical protein
MSSNNSQHQDARSDIYAQVATYRTPLASTT